MRWFTPVRVQVRTVTMGGGFDMHSMAWDDFTRADFVHAF